MKPLVRIDRRHFIRHPLSFPLEYTVLGRKTDPLHFNKRVKTINISRAGLMFSARHPVRIGAMVRITMPIQGKIFKVRAIVTHCAKNFEAPFYNIGVRFYRFSDAFKVKLIEQLYLILEYRDLRRIQIGREVTLEEASKEWIKRYSERFHRLYW